MGAANVVACGLFQEHSVQLIAAMIRTLERLALELGCQRVLIVVPETGDPVTIGRLATILEDSEYRLTNTTFSKPIEQPRGKGRAVKRSDRETNASSNTARVLI
jgi:hypothetical protein